MTTIRCSSLPRLAACPGSFHACAGLTSGSSAVAESGTRIHLFLECHFKQMQINVALDAREQGIADWFIREAEKIIESHGGALRVLPEKEIETLFMGGFKLTGHIDLLVICKDGVRLVFDWKTGYAECPEAAGNKQLLGYACLVEQDYGIGCGIEAYIFNAGDSENKLSGTLFGFSNRDSMLAKVQNIMQRAADEDEGRIPSESACKYCTAKCSTRCPETLAEIGAAATLLPAVTESLLPASKEAVVRIWNMAKEAERLAAAYIDRVKAEVIASPEAWEGVFKVKGTGNKTIILSVKDIYKRLVIELGILSDEEFFEGVDFSFNQAGAAAGDRLKLAGINKGEVVNTLKSKCEGMYKEDPKSPTVKAV